MTAKTVAPTTAPRDAPLIEGPARLGRVDRLRRRGDFEALKRGGARADAPHLALVYRPNAFGHRRFGVTVSTRVGGAVVRNRVKRWLREAYRRHPSEFPPSADLNAIARPGIDRIGYAGVAEELVSCGRRAMAQPFQRRPAKRRDSPS